MLRSVIRRAINAIGYDLSRVPIDDTAARYADFPRESLRQKRFYNIGAGGFEHPYWTNVDLASEWYSSVQNQSFLNHDLMALGPLPIEDSTAELFYCSHVIEHISDAAVANLCNEVHRSLKPGGIIRFLTPDAELEFSAFRRGDKDFFPWVYEWPHAATASLERIFLNHFASQVSEYGEPRPGARAPVPDGEIAQAFATLPMEEAFEHFTRQCSFDPKYVGNHINWWTEKKLGLMLHDAGFSCVYRSGHNQSLSRPLRDLRYFDAPYYTRFSLYMEATK